MALRPTRAEVYLGDGVYVRVEPQGDLVLTMENGISAMTTTMVLEPGVLANLLAFVRYKQRAVDES
jgi:hypothetical protein